MKTARKLPTTPLPCRCLQWTASSRCHGAPRWKRQAGMHACMGIAGPLSTTRRLTEPVDVEAVPNAQSRLIDRPQRSRPAQ